MNKLFSIQSRIRSFKFAINGIVHLIRFEHNSRIHLMFAAIAIALSIFLKISLIEWMFIVFAIGFVLAAELLNSAIERMIDLHSAELSDKAGQAKDMAAAAVLIAAITSLVIGCIIFVPKLLEKL